MILTQEEQHRYARHLTLPQFGIAAQQKLKNAKVLVVGAGGLGAPILQYLTAAGVGTIGVVDFDTIDKSNLQRQVLFSEVDLGKPKTSVAIQKLKAQNSNVNFIEHAIKITNKNALEIIQLYDVIVDGSDNFATRYLVNDACVLLKKPLIFGAIYQFEGQVSVFNYKGGPNYRDLFAKPPVQGSVPSCTEGGVLGVLPGIIGSLQALEAIKVITDVGTTLSGKLLLFNAISFDFRKLNIKKDPRNPISGENVSITQLIDYEQFCEQKPINEMKSITVEDLKNLKESGADFTLIDVREEHEYESANLGGALIPLGEVVDNLDKIPKEGNVIIQCKSGGRSGRAIQMLEQRYGYENLSNLEGGILAWREAYEPDMVIL